MLLFILVMMVNFLGDLEGSRLVRCPPVKNSPLNPGVECEWKREDSLCWDTSCLVNISTGDETTLKTFNDYVEITFPMGHVVCDNNTDYDIELRVSEHLNPVQCKMASTDLFTGIHSRRSYNVTNDCTDNVHCLHCSSKTGVAIFPNIFDGCYWLKIQPISNVPKQTKQLIRTCPQYLRSDKRKQYFAIADKVPHILPIYRDELRELQVKVNYTPLVNNNVQEVTISIENLNNNLSVECSVGAFCYMTAVNCCLQMNMSDRCRGICQIEDEEINCTFSNVSAGNYSVRFRTDDERCDIGTVWSEREALCKWDVPCEAKAGPPNTNMTEIRINSYTLVGVLVLVAVALAAFGTWSVCRLSPRFIKTIDASGNLAVVVPPAGDILLLYSRDCHHFMELMASLRRILQNATSTKVYDCFDSRHWDEISRDPLSWVRKLLHREDMKVVIVASRCASWRHQALCSRQTLRYREPSSLDPLFLATVKELQQTPPSDVYSRVFVIRFQELTDDTDLFANLNSYARFVLPSHLSALLTQLSRSSFTDMCTDLRESEEWIELQQNLENLIKYTNQNADYLQDMFTIQKINNYSSFIIE